MEPPAGSHHTCFPASVGTPGHQPVDVSSPPARCFILLIIRMGMFVSTLRESDV
jgi:hypothetical protein